MGILDFIKNIFTSNKKNAQIHVEPLTKTYGDPEPLEIALYENEIPLVDKTIQININGKTYDRTTDNDGIARLNINLQSGHYTPLISFKDPEYNQINTFTDIYIKSETWMEGTDIVKTCSEKSVYQCAVYTMGGERLTSGSVDIRVNGVKYTRSITSDGLARLNINLNQPGEYPVTAEYNGSELYNTSSVSNIITVNNDPAPAPKVEAPKVEPQKSRSEKILDEFEKYFGTVEYIDDALAKIRSKGYAFYFSDGYNMYDTIKRIANGKGANCYDSSEVFYHLALGMNTKYGRNYEPQYLHVWCPVSGYDHIRLRFKTSSGYFYRDPASVLDGGSVESNWCGTSNNILEVNPSFIIDG